MVLPRPTELSGRGLRLLAHGLRIAPPAAIPVFSRWPAARALSSSAAHLKKRKIAAPSNSPTRSPPSTTEPSSQDPLDLSALTAALERTDAHFKTRLHPLLHGGRFDPSSLGALPVAVKPEAGKDDDDDGGARSFPLRELAQVVPRSGRAISLLVHDGAYVKPIMSAVQASPDFNQQPQRAPDNHLELLLRVELDRPEDLVRRVRDAVQAWRDAVRHDRAKHDRLLKEWRRTGAVLPDVGRKAEKEVQKLQDKKMKEIDAEEARALRQLDRG